MSTSHVSDSLGTDTRTEPRELRDAVPCEEKQLRVAEHVVREMLVSKKRMLTIEVNAAMEALHQTRAPALQCGCAGGAAEQCGAVPCARRVQLREALFGVISRECWPKYEKELIADMARALIAARKAGGGRRRLRELELARELAEVAALQGRVAGLETPAQGAAGAKKARSAEGAAGV